MKLPQFKLPGKSKEQAPKKPVLLGNQQTKTLIPAALPKPSLSVIKPLVEKAKETLVPILEIPKGDIYWLLRIDDKAKEKKRLHDDFMEQHFGKMQKEEPTTITEPVRLPRKKVELPQIKIPSSNKFLIKFYNWGKKK